MAEETGNDKLEAPSEQKKRVTLYLRLSNEDQVNQKALAIERQRELCEKLVADHEDWEWARVREFVDDGVSGYDPKSLKKRIGFENLRKEVEARQIDIVVSYAIDRISRRVLDIAKFAELLDLNKAKLVTYREREVDFLQLHLHAILAQSESNSLSVRLKAKFEHDFFTGDEHGPIPKVGVRAYGYQRCEDKTDRKHYEIDEGEAKVIRIMAAAIPRIYSKKGKDRAYTSTTLITELRKMDARTPQGKQSARAKSSAKGGSRTEPGPRNLWTWQAIRHKLESPTIAGYMRHHEFIRPAKWEPIIDFEQWEEMIENFGWEIEPTIEHGEDIKRMVRKPIDQDNNPNKDREHYGRVGALSGLLETPSPVPGTPNVPMRAEKTTSKKPDGSKSEYLVYAANSPKIHTSIQRHYLDQQIFKRIENRLWHHDYDNYGLFEKLQTRSAHDIRAELDQANEELQKYLLHEHDSDIEIIEKWIETTKERVRRLQSELRARDEDYLQPSIEGEMAIDKWYKKASVKKKFELADSLIERIVIGTNDYAIAALKKRYQVETNYQWKTLQVEHPWLDPKLDLKTQLKADWRTTVYWRDGSVDEPGSLFASASDPERDLSDEDLELCHKQPQKTKKAS